MTVQPTEKTPAPRCGHETSTGPCYRPEGHPKTGHISKAALDAKRAKGKSLTPSRWKPRKPSAP